MCVGVCAFGQGACYGGDSGGGDGWVCGCGLVMVVIVVVVMVGWVGGGWSLLRW